VTNPNQPLAPTRWTPQQLGAFVDHVRDDRFFALWLLIATTGIRIDTLLDLRRQDVDLQESRLSPRPSAVTGRGASSLGVVRSYALDPDAHEALREHVIAWDKERLGPDQRSKHLFVWTDGAPIHPKSVDVLFRRHCHNAGLPAVPLQAMRQAYVVAALETGIPTAVISERLGRVVTPGNIGRIPQVDPPARRVHKDPGTPTRPPSDPERRRSCRLRSC
jgi:integrase